MRHDTQELDRGLPDPVVDTEVTSTIDYVALGDSFSAGPFIGTMRTDPEGCARSKDNYPAFLADSRALLRVSACVFHRFETLLE